jgi:methyl-accepting chemotaxis protein
MTNEGDSQAAGRHQRRLRNFLLDPHFQLKYSAYLVVIAVLLSAGLGTILWRTSEQVLVESRKNVEQGQRIVELGSRVVAESRKVSQVVEMNIVEDPVYRDNPALLDAFTRDAGEREASLGQQEKSLVAQAEALRAELESLARSRSRVTLALCLALALLVVGIFLAGIVVTHKVAGPIHKMNRQLREVGDGHLRVPGKLRRGDELAAFFNTFDRMVRNLRARQEGEIEKLDAAIAKLEREAEAGRLGTSGAEALMPLHELRQEMKDALDT